MTDDRLGTLLRGALPPTRPGASRRDLWPLVAKRLDERPRWSWIDSALSAAVTVSLLSFPEWLWLLVYHF